jgi:hypothetical protein
MHKFLFYDCRAEKMVLGTLFYIILVIIGIIIIVLLLSFLFNLFFVAPMGIDTADLEFFKGSIIALHHA